MNDVKRAEALADYVLERLQNPLPARQSVGCDFDLVDGINVGRLAVSADSAGKLTVEVGIYKNNTDCVFSNFLFEVGETQEEIIKWLQNKNICGQIIQQCWSELAEKSNEYWEEH